MPELYHLPRSRRFVLKTSLLAGVATITGTAKPAQPDSDSLHLALLSDTHVPGDRKNGHRGMNPWENLKRIVPELTAAKPEGVIINGDAARLSGLKEDYVELKALLEPVANAAPIYIAMGNHDDRKPFHQVFDDEPGRLKDLRNKHVLVLEHPTVRVVVLDSLLYVNKVAGLLGKGQRDWLAGWLEQNKDRPVVFFVHHTLGDGDGDLLDANRMFGILKEQPHVKAVFYGHSHCWDIGERDGIRLINLPAVGYNFSDNQPLGWVDARFDATGADLTLRAFGGSLAGNGKLTRLDWR